MVNVIGNDLRNMNAMLKTGIGALSGAVSGNMELKKRLTRNIIPDMTIKTQHVVINKIILDFKSLCSASNALKKGKVILEEL
jgi:hypothetical protein